MSRASIPCPGHPECRRWFSVRQITVVNAYCSIPLQNREVSVTGGQEQAAWTAGSKVRGVQNFQC
jgi:hypothetical protein